MKYFTSDENGQYNLGSVTSARHYLKEHPDKTCVYRWWWSGSDLIDVEEVSRENLFAKRAKQLESGATAQWSIKHQ